MSSYKVDKNGLPILYLQDGKNALWEKFSETYPNGMKRTAFMARLQDGPYRYRADLGGLCSACAEYGYAVFETLSNLVKTHVTDNNVQVCVAK
jgi:hypothetical protein